MNAQKYRMRRQKADRIARISIFITLGLALVCGVIFLTSSKALSLFSNKNASAVALSQNTPSITATPFLPVISQQPASSPALTATPDPDALGDWTDTYSTPPPSTPLPKTDTRVNVLFLGSDQRPDEGIYRTDVILLISLDTKTQKASMVSFPRDLFVYIPGSNSMGRINTAYSYDGFSGLADTLQYNFGIRPDHYALATFDGFRSLINSLGGIDVEVNKSFADECLLVFPECPDGYLSLEPGTTHMNGQFALWYVTSRQSTSDLDRTRRVQEVILAIYQRLMRMDAIMHAPAMFKLYQNNVETDITLADITPLLPAAKALSNLDNIRGFTMGEQETTNYIDPTTGAMVLLPNYDAIRQMLVDALSE